MAADSPSPARAGNTGEDLFAVVTRVLLPRTGVGADFADFCR